MSKRAAFVAAVEADASLSEKSAKAKALAATIMEKYDRNQDGEFNLGEVVDIVEVPPPHPSPYPGARASPA